MQRKDGMSVLDRKSILTLPNAQKELKPALTLQSAEANVHSASGREARRTKRLTELISGFNGIRLSPRLNMVKHGYLHGP
mmetsp:Transcript_133426/g.231855  ORF Transcript_133426/g.231855 Transcript_133426/m.231855 type:complete len:80 (+) Transcript_133426:154-393(+)